MYFSTACLIGLRPLLSRLTGWLKRHQVAISSKNSGHQSRSESVPLAPLKRHPSKRRGFDELDSISHIVSRDQDLECEPSGNSDTGGESADNIKPGIGPIGNIRVHTSIEVNSMNEDPMKGIGASYSQYF